MYKIIKIFSVMAILSMAVASVSLAQTDTVEVVEEISEEVILDETVTAAELGIGEPSLLPDSKFYFLKNWKRGLKSTFTFDKTKKAELKLQYASEKLLEAKKLANKNKRPEILEKAMTSFQREIEKVKLATDEIQGTASTSPKVGKFLDKFVQQQVLHQKILDKLEEKVPEGVLEKIQQTRERHLEKFGQVMEKLEDKTQIKSRIENNLDKLKGSEFKGLKEMEILKRFENAAPEGVKEKIAEAREGRLVNFKEKFELMPSQVREKFDGYMEKMKGKGADKMEILENIKDRIKLRPDIQEKLEQAQTNVIGRTGQQNDNNGLRCQTSTIAPRDCKGKIIIERKENGCPFPRCIPITIEETPTVTPPSTGTGGVANKPTACITLWDPVCGANGRTYGNACKAKASGVAIKHKGACKQELIRDRVPKPVVAPPPTDTTQD